MNVVVRCKEVLYSILMHDGTAEPLRVSPPEAVAYLLELLWEGTTVGVDRV